MLRKEFVALILFSLMLSSPFIYAMLQTHDDSIIEDFIIEDSVIGNYIEDKDLPVTLKPLFEPEDILF